MDEWFDYPLKLKLTLIIELDNLQLLTDKVNNHKGKLVKDWKDWT